MSLKLKLLYVTIAPLLVIGAVSSARADDWNAGTANWFINSNWLDNSIPTPGDNVNIDNAGTAQVGVAGAVARTLQIGRSGTGSLSISNGGTVNNRTGRIGSNFGSTGAVTVTGTGSTWTNSRNLEIGRSGTGNLSISNGGMVSNRTGIIGNVASGNGSVIVDGTGSTWANSRNLFVGNRGTGSLSISNGGLVTNTSSRIGNVGSGNGSVTVDGTGSTWANSSTLFIGNNGTGNLSISNGGVVDVTGTVTLANNAGAVGTLNIGTGGSAGVLNTSLINGRTGTAILNFNHTDSNYFFTGNGMTSGSAIAITGSTAVNHIGSGTTILTGANTYNGATTINAGTLLVNGSNINSTSTVNTGGTLGGTGTVGTININNGGTFAPGNSIGTTSVTGNVVFNAGSNYNVEVNAAGNSDLISTTGAATLTGGTVNVQAAIGAYNLSTDYTILTAAGGLGGTTFNSVNSNLAFLDPTLSYDANNVFLNLTRNSTAFNGIAITPNQIAVSTVVAALSTSNPAAIQDILNNLLLLTSTGANQAFDSLSGVQHTHSPLITQRVSQRFSQLLLSRSSQSSSTKFAFTGQQNFVSMSGPLLAYNGNDLASLVSANTSANVENSMVPERGLWLSGFGGFGNIDNSINASGVDFDTGGVAFGADHEWRDFVIGIAGSYARSDADTFGGDMNIDSYQAATYGTWQKNAFYLNTMIGFGAHKTDATRAVIVGPATSTAKADYYTYNVNTAIEAGKDIALSPLTTISPFLGVDYIHSNRESFTESGAGTANLNVSNEDLDSLRTSVGFRMSHEISTQKIQRITPYTTIAYVREHIDNVVRMNAGFAAAPTTPFQISGSKLDRDRLRVGFGIVGQLNERATVNISYYGNLADSHAIHSFSVTGRYIW